METSETIEDLSDMSDRSFCLFWFSRALLQLLFGRRVWLNNPEGFGFVWLVEEGGDDRDCKRERRAREERRESGKKKRAG